MRIARFAASLVPAVLLLILFFGLTFLVSARIGGGLGMVLGLVAGASTALGLLLAYWVLVDVLNLRLIRRHLDSPALADGEIVAFEGVVHAASGPMRSPFSGTACAAYTYTVASSRHAHASQRSRRHVLAIGHHLAPTRLDGNSRALWLRTVPAVEDDLRRQEDGTTWGDQARARLAAVAGSARRGGAGIGEAHLAEARATTLAEVHEDFVDGEIGARTDGLIIDEEVLPDGARVCVIGTYEAESAAITPRRRRLGPNVMVYRGAASEILERVGRDTRGFTRAAAVLVGLGLIITAAAVIWPAVA